MVTSNNDRSAKVVEAHRDAASSAVSSPRSTAEESNGSNDSISSPVVGFTLAIGGPESAGVTSSVSPTSAAPNVPIALLESGHGRPSLARSAPPRRAARDHPER